MDNLDCVNIFLSEGAGVKDIVAEMEAKGEEVPCDAFGHVKLDKINPGHWFAATFAPMIKAEKVLVQVNLLTLSQFCLPNSLCSFFVHFFLLLRFR